MILLKRFAFLVVILVGKNTKTFFYSFNNLIV